MDASNDSFSYLSEPTSPSRCGKEGFFFYSLPATPGFSPSPSPSQPATPCLFEDAYSSFDVFEFETSRRLGLKLVDLEHRPDFDGRIDAEKHLGRRRLGITLPEMTFADELFSDGKVRPLLPPLKLPPRLQRDNNGYNTGCKKSPTASSPRSPISALKSKFSRNNLFDANFDPFTAALENVRQEDGGKTLEDKSRPANSLSPARRQRFGGTLGLIAHKNVNMGLHSPLLAHKVIGPRPNILGRSGWADLKGLAIARKFKLLKTEFESKVGPLPLVKTAKKKKEPRETTFFWRPKSKKPIKSKFTKMTLVPCRLKFPLCLGFGSRYDD